MKLILCFTTLFLLQCAHNPKTSQEIKQDKANWQADMHKLALSMSKLLPLAVSSKEFHNPANSKIINTEMQQLVEVSKNLENNEHATKGDPILKFTAKKFSEDLGYAYEQYKMGNSDFAQNNIRNATTYCMGCHTRNNQGRKLEWSWGVDLDKLNKLDQAQYLTAIRDFDKALMAYRNLLSNKKLAMTSPQSWETSAKKSMAILVRVKRDPVLAGQIVNEIINFNSVPPSMQQTLLEWQKSIKEWEKDNNLQKKIQKTSHKEQLAKANQLLQKGWQSTQFPQSSAGAIYFLRASSLLHDLLESPGTKKEEAQALYTAGLVAERLKDINLWTLHEAYYESCIRTLPRTQLAKKCYLRYEAVVLANYIDNHYAGQVPVHIRNHLDRLRKTAEMGNWNELLNWGLVE
ncbi:MAG: hypothetical protein H6625_02920 [Bdellovibrionaceae bacterium]|nr:hypothetical protein [Pseudobdellovibrionaceae bacterium]